MKSKWKQSKLCLYLQKEKMNTYLLALDGDTDFQPAAVMLLIDRLKLYPLVGAACGRIHPTGSGWSNTIKEQGQEALGNIEIDYNNWSSVKPSQKQLLLATQHLIFQLDVGRVNVVWVEQMTMKCTVYFKVTYVQSWFMHYNSRPRQHICKLIKVKLMI